MKFVTILLWALSAIGSTCQAQSGVYKHVDQHGHVIYSDIEAKGTNEIALPEITVLPAARYSPANQSVKKYATSLEQNKAIDIKNDQDIKPTHLSEAVHRNSTDKEASQLSDQDRLEHIIEEMALYENDIEALEIQLYNLGSGY